MNESERRHPLDHLESRLPVDLASCAHEIATGFASLDVALDQAIAVTDKAFADVSRDDLEYLGETLDAIRRQVVAQLYEAQNFLAVAAPQFTAGMYERRIGPTNLVNILESNLKYYKTRAKNRSIDIFIERPRGSPTPLIDVDPAEVRRAFHNVLSNALKYSYHGTREQRRHIRIWYGWRINKPHGRMWAISFQNYGPGILESELGDILTPGYRGTLARRERIVGAGLGLSEVAKCMDRYAGIVKVDSNLTHADTYITTVVLMFPVH